MVQTSELYKELFRLYDTKTETRAIIGTETYDIDRIVSCNCRLNSFATGSPSVGGCIAGECDLVIRDYGDVPKMARIQLKIRLVNGERASEWIQKGTFFIDNRLH